MRDWHTQVDHVQARSVIGVPHTQRAIQARAQQLPSVGGVLGDAAHSRSVTRKYEYEGARRHRVRAYFGAACYVDVPGGATC